MIDDVVAEASRLAQSHPDAASRLLDEAEAAGRVRGAAVPAALYLRARLTLEAGRPEEALALIAAARAGYADQGLLDAALRTDLGRMHVLDDLGRHHEAAEMGRELLAAVAELPADRDEGRAEERTGLRAAALGNLGVALGFTGAHEEALAAYREAEATWRQLGANYGHETAVAVANQGVEAAALGRAEAALACFAAAIPAFEAAEDRLWLAKCLGHRGEALTTLGRFVEALAEYQQARGMLDDLGVHTEAWRLSVEIGSTFLALGLRDEALTVTAGVEPELRRAGLNHDLAAVRRTAGLAEAALGRSVPARAALREAVDLYAEVGDRPRQALTLLDLSRYVDSDRALLLVEQAAALTAGGSAPDVACQVALRLADLSGLDHRADAHLARARELADEVGIPHLRQAVGQRLGSARLRRGDLDGAIAALGEALDLVEEIGSGLNDPSLRAAYVGSRNAAQDELIAALLRRGGDADVARAAALADRAKGRTLMDLLTGALRPRPAPQDAASRLLTGGPAAGYSALLTADRSEQPGLRARIEHLERQISVSEALTPTAAPSRAAGRSTPRDAPLASAVAYHVLDEEVLAFVTVAGRTTVRRRICEASEVLRLLDDLEAHLGSHAVDIVAQHGAARAAACQRVLQQLYLAVFAPLADLLPPPARPAPLVVVPHGPLHRIPFHALHDGRLHLLAYHVITVAPSLDAARHAAARPPRSGGTLVVGVADETTPFIEDEATTVAWVAGDATLLLGEQATFESVRWHAQRSSLVHLACHGLFRPENSAFSSLRLADRWIRAADIAELDLDGAVLVLSACETGRVDAARGDEATGFARSLLASGARCVVVSQWLADDRSTAALMVAMHEHLAAGADPATALRLAQLAALRQRPHPFHWAPFIAVGAPAPA